MKPLCTQRSHAPSPRAPVSVVFSVAFEPDILRATCLVPFFCFQWLGNRLDTTPGKSLSSRTPNQKGPTIHCTQSFLSFTPGVIRPLCVRERTFGMSGHWLGEVCSVQDDVVVARCWHISDKCATAHVKKFPLVPHTQTRRDCMHAFCWCNCQASWRTCPDWWWEPLRKDLEAITANGRGVRSFFLVILVQRYYYFMHRTACGCEVSAGC